MKLQKHPTKKGTSYFKWEVILPDDKVKEAGFEEGEELAVEAKKGKITLKKENKK